MYPLFTNDRNLSALEVLAALKRQPTIEKRFAQAAPFRSSIPSGPTFSGR